MSNQSTDWGALQGITGTHQHAMQSKPPDLWFDMTTAPHDGSQFIGWNGVRRVIVSWAAPYYEGGSGEWTDDACRRIDPPLTCWAPLLERPA